MMSETISKIGAMMQPPAAGLALARDTVRLAQIGASLCQPVWTMPVSRVRPTMPMGMSRRRSR